VTTAARIIEIPYAPRPQQKTVHASMSKARFGVLVCHRRFGKTVLAVNELLKGAMTCKKTRPRFAYIGPTYRQSKQVAWDYAQHYSRPIPGQVPNQSELRIDYPNHGQLRLYGSDNPDSLRGIYLDGAVLDEYGMHPAKTFSEVLSATLVDRGGWAMFCGTPNGRNQFYEIAEQAKAEQAAGNTDWFYAEHKASETGLLDPDYLRSARMVMTEDEYQQEFECSFAAAVKGAIYSKELFAAQSRIREVPYDPTLPVDTDWDLGIGDAMAIWFSQSLRSGEVRVIDYYEASGEGFPHYAAVLQGKGYVYGQHWAPHDIEVRELGSGRSRMEVAAGLGIRFRVVPRLHGAVGQEVEDGIHAVRMLFPRCYFDAVRCKAGLEALANYRRDYNQRLNEFKAVPVHDWSSHAADAFRGLAVRHHVPREKRPANNFVPVKTGGAMSYAG
jgi:phage terminase large subunit